jgi:hypothetical protein
MIKINLLPPSINAAKQRNIAIGVIALLIAAEIGAVIFVRQGPLATKAELENRKSEAQSQQNELSPFGQQSTQVLGDEAALAPKYDFITNMMKYNREYPNLYRTTARYTYAEVMFLNLEAQQNSLRFDAYVSSPVDVSRLMLGLTRHPQIQGLPTLSGVPGFDEAEQARRREEERQREQQANLPGSSIIGAAPGGAAGEAGGGFGMMGAPGGANGPGGGGMMPGAVMGPGGGMGGGGGNGPGGPSVMGAPAGGASMGMSMGAGPQGMEGMMGAMGGGGGGGGNLGKLGLDAALQKPRGFTVTVTCALRPLMTRPSYGTSDSQAGAGGGGGGGYGGPGGGMGMMPMMSNGPGG